MVTQQTTCTVVDSTVNNTLIVERVHNPTLQGAIAIPPALFNIAQACLFAVFLCCRTQNLRTIVQQESCLDNCVATTIFILLAHLIYCVVCLGLMLVQNCHEIIPTLAMLTIILNLLIGIILITMSPVYLLYQKAPSSLPMKQHA